MRYSESLLLGGITFAFALLAQVFLSIFSGDLSALHASDILTGSLLISLSVAAAIEELIRVFVIGFYFVRRGSQSDWQSFPLHGAAIGLGFALVEISFRLIAHKADSIELSSDLYIGLFGILILHTFLGYLVGFLVTRLHHQRYLVALVIAISVHIAYNVSVFLLR